MENQDDAPPQQEKNLKEIVNQLEFDDVKTTGRASTD